MTVNKPYKITKKEWIGRGGLKNSDLFRKQGKNGKWTYWAGAK